MRRVLLGIFAAGFLLFGGYALWLLPESDYGPAGASALRIGLVLAILWIALPDLNSPRTLIWFGGGAAALMLLTKAKALVPIVAVLALVYFVIRPRRRRTDGPTQSPAGRRA